MWMGVYFSFADGQFATHLWMGTFTIRLWWMCRWTCSHLWVNGCGCSFVGKWTSLFICGSMRLQTHPTHPFISHLTQTSNHALQLPSYPSNESYLHHVWRTVIFRYSHSVFSTSSDSHPALALCNTDSATQLFAVCGSDPTARQKNIFNCQCGERIYRNNSSSVNWTSETANKPKRTDPHRRPKLPIPHVHQAHFDLLIRKGMHLCWQFPSSPVCLIRFRRFFNDSCVLGNILYCIVSGSVLLINGHDICALCGTGANLRCSRETREV